ncbi:MAG: YdcF family protein [Anaerolineae bacterium]|nr:YdcF family protein [Anaerolineae bacterium]
MGPDQKLSASEDELTWPETPSAILIMGKRQGTKKENKQLRGRVAMAAALWYSAPQPKPYLLFVASDVHGPARRPDAKVVKSTLLEKFQIPADYLIVRRRANCTMLEVRAARALRRAYGLAQIFAITHLYHAPRAQRYLDEAWLNAAVIPVHPAILAEITFPAEYADLLPELRAMIIASLPGRLDNIREHLIEWLLGLAHTLDRRGRFERQLAWALRPTAYR